MIRSKDDLKYYLHEDLKRYGGKTPSLRDYVLHKEWVVWWRYQKLIRKFEYYENNKDKNLIFKILWLWYYYKHRKMSLCLQSFIFPNTVEPGLLIFHVGQVLISNKAKIGRGFTCRPGCVIGNVRGETNGAVIGDNVELSLGVKVFGAVTIGRGALINGNSVVLNNIPPYAIAVGNPAKVIGFRMTPKQIKEYEKTHYEEKDRIPLKDLEYNYNKYFLKRRKEIINFIKF